MSSYNVVMFYVIELGCCLFKFLFLTSGSIHSMEHFVLFFVSAIAQSYFCTKLLL